MSVVTGFKLVTKTYGPLNGRGDHVFAVGSVHTIDGTPALCKRGFHFSPTPLMCLMSVALSHDLLSTVRLLKVEANAADTVACPRGTKFATKTLRIVDEVADVHGALTGTVHVDNDRHAFVAARLHQLSDDVPATRRTVAEGTFWRWHQNAVYGRCDGDASLPTVAALLRNGRRRYEWRRPDGTLQRGDGKAAKVEMRDGRVIVAEWSETAAPWVVFHNVDLGCITVTYDHKTKLALQQGHGAVLEVTNAVRRIGFDVDAASGTVTAADVDEVRIGPLVQRLAADATLLSFDHWIDVLEQQRPPVDVIDVVLAAERKQ
jgi:hypothetical protein